MAPLAHSESDEYGPPAKPPSSSTAWIILGVSVVLALGGAIALVAALALR